MESRPPKIIETILAWLTPPACREEFLGDLRERYQNLAHYLAESAHALICVIYSRIRRTTDAVVALMEALSLFTSFVLVALWLDRPLLFEDHSFARLAIPAAIAIAVVILADAYANPKRRWPLKPLFAPILGIAIAFAWELTHPTWSLPLPILAWGSASGAILVSTLRLMFPPIADRPQASGAPAFWQKLELAPVAPRVKDALVAVVVMLAVILFLIAR
jgi:hypothetical protein